MAPPQLPPGVRPRRGGASGPVSRAGGRRVVRRGNTSNSNRSSKTDHIKATDLWERTDDSKLLKRAKKQQRKRLRDEGGDEGLSARGCGLIVLSLLFVITSLMFLNPNEIEIDSPERAATALADSCVLIWDFGTRPDIIVSSFATLSLLFAARKYWQKYKQQKAEKLEQDRETMEKEQKLAANKKRWEEKQARREKYKEAEEIARLRRLEEIKRQAIEEQKIREDDLAFQQEMDGSENGSEKESNEWTQEQQLAFEDALGNNPPHIFRTTRARWEAISREVESKSIKECVSRFKAIRALLSANKDEQGNESPENETGLERWLQGESAGAYADRFLYVDGESSEEEFDDQDGSSRVRLQVDVQVNPQPGWAKLSLDGLATTNIGIAQAGVLRLQVACERCSEVSEQTVGGVFVDHSAHTWHCKGCGSSNRIELVPCFVHVNNTVLGYVDCSNCEVHDILKLSMIAQCLQCGSGLGTSRSGMGDLCTLDSVKRGVRSEALCRDCHSKVTLSSSTFTVDHVDVVGVTGTAEDAWKKKKKAEKSKQVKKGKFKAAKPQGTFKVGNALPDNGACKHFRKSYRWMRFPCCGRAFPCPICHATSGCEESNTATRMICGKCSFESKFANVACGNCEFHMGVAKSKSGGKAGRFWDGGSGTRSTKLLSKNDSRKNKGISRSGVSKTSSKKAERVGKAGKMKRES